MRIAATGHKMFATRFITSLAKNLPSRTSLTEPSHALTEPELCSAWGSASLTERDVRSAEPHRAGPQLGEAR